MSDEIIPDDVRAFILDHIDSVAFLEALQLLRNFAQREWTVEEVANRLYVGETVANEILVQLTGKGLCVSKDAMYCYGPRNPDQNDVIDRLCDTYARRLVAVTKLIHDKPTRIQKFADAFKFRKDK